MKLNIKLLLYLIAVSFLGCQEEEVCVGCNLNPKIKIQFEAIETKQLTDSLLTEVKSKIAQFVDSLSTQLTDQERSELLEELSLLREDSIKYDEIYSLLRVGKTIIDVIDAPGALNMEQFQDTVIRNFAIPVDMNHDTSTFYFTYHGFTDTLELHYQRSVIQNFDGIRMRLSDIGVNKEISTFDSIRIKCYNVECSNDRTTIYVYF
jgi:uncharacterized protein (DUF1499 family)